MKNFFKIMLAMCVCVAGMLCMSVCASADTITITSDTDITSGTYDTIIISSGEVTIYGDDISIDTIYVTGGYLFAVDVDIQTVVVIDGEVTIATTEDTTISSVTISGGAVNLMCMGSGDTYNPVLTIETLEVTGGEVDIQATAYSEVNIGTFTLEDGEVTVEADVVSLANIDTLYANGGSISFEGKVPSRSGSDANYTIDLATLVQAGADVYLNNVQTHDFYYISGTFTHGTYSTEENTSTGYHDMIYYSAATCTEAGYEVACYVCEGSYTHGTTGGCGLMLSAEDYSVLTSNTYYEEGTGHSYTYTSNGDGTHTGVCSECGDEVTEECTYEDGVCTYCSSTESSDDDTDADEEDTDDSATDDSTTTTTTTCTHSSTTSVVNYVTGTKTTTCDSCGEVVGIEYNCYEYIQYIGGILMNGTKITDAAAEDVSTGAGMTAEETTSTSAIAVVSLMGIAMMIARKRK